MGITCEVFRIVTRLVGYPHCLAFVSVKIHRPCIAALVDSDWSLDDVEFHDKSSADIQIDEETLWGRDSRTPKTEPCATPEATVTEEELLILTATSCNL